MNKKSLSSIALVTGAVISAAAIYGTAEANKPGAYAPPPVKVALATAQRQAVPRAFNGIGELEAAHQVQLAAEVSGRVTRIAFSSGQSVKAGQLLVQLNDAPEQADRLRLQAQWKNAQSVYDRTRKLLAENAATQEQLDSAAAARDTALGELRRVDALIAQKAIRAPFSGVVGIRRVHEGQYLNAADTVASLVDTHTLYANFALDEQSSPRLTTGQVVTLKIDAWPDRDFTAKINAIDPMVARSRTVQIQATLANADGRLKPGMYAGIRVARQDAADALTVPESAVTYTAYGETVFVASGTADGKQPMQVKRVAVKSGERFDGRIEISDGLTEGDRVVTSGQLKLNDGMAVMPVDTDTVKVAP